MTTAPPPPFPSWYVVHTKPQKELVAASMLEERLALTVYLPEVLQHYRGETHLRPFFPRYLFVQANLDEVEASKINAMPGVISIVSFGEKPQALSDEVVQAIRGRIDDYNAAGGLPQRVFQPGDRVRLTEGPLQGLEAIFKGPTKPSQRVWVLLEFLGSLHAAEVSIDSIERAAPQHLSRHKRGTRGRGRHIHSSGDRSAASHSISSDTT